MMGRPHPGPLRFSGQDADRYVRRYWNNDRTPYDRWAPFSYNAQYLYPVADYSYPSSFEDCCIAAGYSQEACSSPGVACPIALNTVTSGGSDAGSSAAVASYCCPIAYREWGYGYGGAYY